MRSLKALRTLVCLLCAVAAVAGGARDASACHELGFGADLDCARCTEFAGIIGAKKKLLDTTKAIISGKKKNKKEKNLIQHKNTELQFIYFFAPSCRLQFMLFLARRYG